MMKMQKEQYITPLTIPSELKTLWSALWMILVAAQTTFSNPAYKVNKTTYNKPKPMPNAGTISSSSLEAPSNFPSAHTTFFSLKSPTLGYPTSVGQLWNPALHFNFCNTTQHNTPKTLKHISSYDSHKMLGVYKSPGGNSSKM